jgi:hypothetical protein
MPTGFARPLERMRDDVDAAGALVLAPLAKKLVIDCVPKSEEASNCVALIPRPVILNEARPEAHLRTAAYATCSSGGL